MHLEIQSFFPKCNGLFFCLNPFHQFSDFGNDCYKNFISPCPFVRILDSSKMTIVVKDFEKLRISGLRFWKSHRLQFPNHCLNQCLSTCRELLDQCKISFFLHLEHFKLETCEAFQQFSSRVARSFSGFVISVHLAYFITLSIFTFQIDESNTNQEIYRFFLSTVVVNVQILQTIVFVLFITGFSILGHMFSSIFLKTEFSLLFSKHSAFSSLLS